MLADPKPELKPLDEVNSRLKKLAIANKRQLNQTNSTNAQTESNLNNTHLEESKFDLNDKSQLLEISSAEEKSLEFDQSLEQSALKDQEKNQEEINWGAFSNSLEKRLSDRSDFVPLLDLDEKEKIDIEEIKEGTISIDEDEVDLDEIQQGAFSELYEPVRILDQFLEEDNEGFEHNKVSEKVLIEPLGTVP